ncbi:hypothetical protein F8388_017711 [Cannabis sativa]|uniref:Aminotransferase-like plant mobile domain-containing protein n=1 Tax=Cannabis sativa TaxID=3483 RepID=A0A7J6HI75_CANSA|nr:hypothetical protein F8388_017711 [Cannabis sativa]
MGKRKKTFSNSESLPQPKNNIFPCEHSMAPPLRRNLFPRILETDGIYLYQDSMNDYIVPDRDLPLCYCYSKNDLAVEYRSRSGVIQDQLVSYWSKATHTFIVNWGEFTITLEDVYALLLLPIGGTTSLVSPLSNDEQSLLSSSTLAVEDLKKRYIFPSKTSRRTVQSTMFLLACRLAYGNHFPLGAVYLGTLYHNFDSIITEANFYIENKELAPICKSLQPGEPRPWAWVSSKCWKTLCNVTKDVWNFTFCPYLTNNCTYFTFDMYSGSVVPLADEVHSTFTTFAGEAGFWFVVCLPRSLLCLRDDPKSLSWSFVSYRPDRVARQFGFDQYVPHDRKIGDLEKAKQSCLLGSFQLSKQSRDTFRLPGKEREGGISVKFANIWMRHHCIGLISRGEACDWEKDVGASSGVYVPSQNSPPLAPSEAPSELCIVDERHTPANLNIRSIEDDVMVALVYKSFDALGGNSHRNDVAVRPNSKPRPFHCSGTNGDSDATTNLTHAPDTDRSTHELCLPTPPSSLLAASSTHVRLERSEDLTTLVGRDAIHLSSYEPEASQFYSRYTSIDKDFASFFKGWKRWISSVATRFSTPLSSAKILSPMLASSDLEIYQFTITLEDVYALLLLSICGTTSLVSPLSNDEQSLLSSLTLAVEDLKKMYMKKKQYDLLNWVRYFHQEDSQDLVELASCISLWLSRYIFPSKTSRRTVQSPMFTLACRLAYGKHFPLGAAYLGTLYHNLDSIITDANSYSENKEVISSIDACFL